MPKDPTPKWMGETQDKREEDSKEKEGRQGGIYFSKEFMFRRNLPFLFVGVRADSEQASSA